MTFASVADSFAPEKRSSEVNDIRTAVLERLYYAVGKDPRRAVAKDWCHALSLVTRDHIVDRWILSTRKTYVERGKRVYYLSMEFLIGRLLGDTLANLDLYDAARDALVSLGQDFDKILAVEADAALGNGGLGRLAACFLDSMSSLAIPAFGYGIRYENGLFRQSLANGWQVEQPEDWLTGGHPWEFERSEVRYSVGFGGSVGLDEDGRARWRPSEEVFAVAYDTPIAGWGANHINTLRLWSAKPGQLFDLDRFNRGRHVEASDHVVRAESLSRVLYPGDELPEGRELRLKQEYFFTAASLQDLVRRFLSEGLDFEDLPEHVSIQLNDTHPAIAVAELVRMLVDDHGLPFKVAMGITVGTVSYTNHTLLPEALERWPVDVFARVLPRHLQIVEAIDGWHRERLESRDKAVSFDAVRVIDPANGGFVRMGQLAFVGSHRVNGVSELHTELMKQTVFSELHNLYPDRIVNETNGITPRRWLYRSNPPLRSLLCETIGPDWIGNLEQIAAAEAFVADAAFRERFHAAKRFNKIQLAAHISGTLGLALDPDALFDIQIKRIHEYKRQLLNIIEAMTLYLAIRREPEKDWTPRVKLLAGKAAPSYTMAKLIIKLANDVAQAVNADPIVGDRLKVVFVPNYNVSLAEIMIPAADLSEQISTAGFEASGTGNMKLALNGALTIGTLDGANVEVRDRVGDHNIFIFGLTADEVAARHRDGWSPSAEIAADDRLAEALAALESGLFSPEDPNRYRAIVDSLRHHDPFLVTADFTSYWATQRRVDAAFVERESWTTKAILNTARCGWFSADRTIRGYAEDVWKLGVFSQNGKSS